jgi:hypothetical protein
MTTALRAIRLVLPLVLVALGACKNDGRTTADEPSDPPDVGLDVDEVGNPDGDATDQDADAAPGLPDSQDDAAGEADGDAGPSGVALVVVEVTPVRAVYLPGFVVEPTASLYDDAASLLPADARAVTWSVEPPDAARVDEDGRYTLLREGRVRFRACAPVRADSPTGDDVCGARSIVVDGGPPTIELFEPLAGAELLASDHETLYVRGRATDSNGTLRVFVNGDRVGLDAAGNFEAFVVPELGVNHIDVVATDGLNRLETRTGRDVLWAPRYEPMTLSETGTLEARLEDALLLQINQVYLDADALIVVPPEATELVIGDIGGLLEFVLRRLDVASLLSNPVVDEDVVQLSVDGVDTSGAIIDITVTETGVEVFASFPEVIVDTRGSLVLLDEVLSLDGSLSAWLSAIVTLEVSKERGGTLEVALDRFEVALENIEPEFASEEANALFALVEGALFASVESLLVDEVAAALVDEIPRLFLSLFESIDASLTGQRIPLDLGLGAPLVLELDAGLATLAAQQRDHLLASVDVRVGVDAAPLYPDTRGSLRSQAVVGPAPLFSFSRLQIAVVEGLLNGLLHTLWNAGLLELDVTEQLPAGIAVLVESVTASGKLPPVLTPVRAGRAGFAFELSLGQLELLLQRGVLQERIGATIRVGAGLRVEAGAILVDVQETPEIDLWLIERVGEPIFEDVAALEALVASAIWPLLLEDLSASLVIELPALDVGALADVAAGVSSITMELALDQPVEVREGTIVVDGAFDAVVQLETP